MTSNMNQGGYQQFNQKTIEMLKAARRQVIQTEKISSATKNTMEEQNPPPKQNSPLKQNPSIKPVLNKFAEEFAEKLSLIEREKAIVDEEIIKLEKLVEKKRQLESRRNELTRLKDKLRELDKEMSDVLKSQSFDKLRIDPEQRRMGQQV